MWLLFRTPINIFQRAIRSYSFTNIRFFIRIIPHKISYYWPFSIIPNTEIKNFRIIICNKIARSNFIKNSCLSNLQENLNQ